MKSFISVLLLLAVSSVASAQIVGGVVGGYGQVVGATSNSSVGAGGGSGAIGNGISGTHTDVTAGNVSAAQATQTLGSTTVITESLSGGEVNSISGSLGSAGALSGGGLSADGSAGGIAGQGIVGGVFFGGP